MAQAVEAELSDKKAKLAFGTASVFDVGAANHAPRNDVSACKSVQKETFACGNTPHHSDRRLTLKTRDNSSLGQPLILKNLGLSMGLRESTSLS